MPTASQVRSQIESALAHKIPGALTPRPSMVRPTIPTGIESLDQLLQGGLPVGAISELVGPECSGRSTIALSVLSHITRSEKVCAWVDVSDSLDPFSAAAAGVDLNRLLWIRCGEKQPQKRPWSRLDQALRVTDLLLQGGGFAAIVLDMGSIAPEYASRIPLASWFRYRAAAEYSRASLILLTQHVCARSSAALVLQLKPARPSSEIKTVLTSLEYRAEILRERFSPGPSNVLPLRKPPQNISQASWQGYPIWVRHA